MQILQHFIEGNSASTDCSIRNHPQPEMSREMISQLRLVNKESEGDRDAWNDSSLGHSQPAICHPCVKRTVRFLLLLLMWGHECTAVPTSQDAGTKSHPRGGDSSVTDNDHPRDANSSGWHCPPLPPLQGNQKCRILWEGIWDLSGECC